ncbi:MAG: LysM domain-containing protein [Chloroflexota bacterium]
MTTHLLNRPIVRRLLTMLILSLVLTISLPAMRAYASTYDTSHHDYHHNHYDHHNSHYDVVYSDEAYPHGHAYHTDHRAHTHGYHAHPNNHHEAHHSHHTYDVKDGVHISYDANDYSDEKMYYSREHAAARNHAAYHSDHSDYHNEHPHYNPRAHHYYTVAYGDTLHSIAHKYGMPVEKLIYMNHISHADYVYIGQQLYVGPSDGYSHMLPYHGDPKTLGKHQHGFNAGYDHTYLYGTYHYPQHDGDKGHPACAVWAESYNETCNNHPGIDGDD